MTAPKAISAARFAIEIDGAEIASFSELGGIISQVTPADYLEADGMELKTRNFGLALPPRIVLKRGVTGSTELWRWHEEVRAGLTAARRNCELVMYGPKGEPLVRYQLEQAWPSKLEIGAAKAGGSAALTETVELVCERAQLLGG